VAEVVKRAPSVTNKKGYLYLITNGGSENVLVLKADFPPTLQALPIREVNQQDLNLNIKKDGKRPTFNKAPLSIFTSNYGKPDLNLPDYAYFARSTANMLPYDLKLTVWTFQAVLLNVPLHIREEPKIIEMCLEYNLQAHVGPCSGGRQTTAICDKLSGALNRPYHGDGPFRGLGDVSVPPLPQVTPLRAHARTFSASDPSIELVHPRNIEFDLSQDLTEPDVETPESETAPVIASPQVHETRIVLHPRFLNELLSPPKMLQAYLPARIYANMLLALSKKRDRDGIQYMVTHYTTTPPDTLPQAAAAVPPTSQTAPPGAALPLPTGSPATPATPRPCGPAAASRAHTINTDAWAFSAAALKGLPPVPTQLEPTKATTAAVPCLFFLKDTCTKGKNCKFIHKRGVIKSAAAATAKVCKYYIGGTCGEGEACTFRHYVFSP
jgi:hypothetical protein